MRPPDAELAARRAALSARLDELGLAAAVVTDPRDLAYLTGFGGATALGPSPFCGPVTCAYVMAAGGSGALVVPQPEDVQPEVLRARVPVRSFATFTDLTPLRPRARLGRAALEALADLGIAARHRIGHQAGSMPVAVAEVLRAGRAGGLVDVDVEVGLLRMRKSATELDAIRRSVAVCDAAQAAVTAAMAPGVTRAQLVAVARTCVDAGAGAGAALVLEVAYGGGADGGGDERALADGDLLLSDIAPCVDGYWGDSCDTRFVGEPSPRHRDAMTTVREALEVGTQAVRPGVTAGAVDAAMRAHVARWFPEYTGAGGHGVGLDYHESPRIIPFEATALEEDMVLALEPGVYLDDAAVRLEHLVRVRADGCEVLSGHLGGHRA